MMIEFEDHDEEGRDLLLKRLAAPCPVCLGAGCKLCKDTGMAEEPRPSEPGCLWHLLGCLYLAWLRRRD